MFTATLDTAYLDMCLVGMPETKVQSLPDPHQILLDYSISREPGGQSLQSLFPGTPVHRAQSSGQVRVRVSGTFDFIQRLERPLDLFQFSWLVFVAFFCTSLSHRL